MKKIINEGIDSYKYEDGTYYIYEVTTADVLSPYRKEIIDVDGSKVELGTKKTEYYTLDPNFNSLVITLGSDWKEKPEKVIQAYSGSHVGKIFLGRPAPFDIICGKKFRSLYENPNDWIGVWGMPSHEQKVHYQSLLENSMLGKPTDKIVEFEHENQQFYIYYTGVTYHDEQAGKKVLVDEHDFLDAGLNRHVLNVKKENAEEMLQSYLAAGCPAFIGSHSPLKPVYIGNGEDAELPNYDTDTVGIWIATSEEEKKRYSHLINKKKAKKMEKELTA